MKPVTAGDVARYVKRQITDPAEEDRIFSAIMKQPELEELYHLLTDDDCGELDENSLSSDAETNSPEHAVRIEQAKDFLSNLQTARLCRLEGFLPAAGADEEISIPLHCSADAPPVECRFVPLPERRGVYRVHADLPAHRRAISLVTADLPWGKPSDLTRKRLPSNWTNRPTPSDKEQTAGSGRQVFPTLAADSGAQDEVESVSRLREHSGDTWGVNLNVAPWTVRIVALARKMLFPMPILLTGLTAGGDVAAAEVRMISHSGQDLENLFEKCTERLHWLQVAPLAIDDAFRLSPGDAATLLGASKYAVCLMKPIPGSRGEYTVDLSDAAVQERLDSKDVVLALQVAEVEGQVQP
ncbi:MAG: hypothetical protein ACKO3T_04735 [Planctomycetaceae bacterium]